MEELEYGCSHYKRKCIIIAPCCKKQFKCRLCHDEFYEDKDDHKINRKDINEIICIKCNTKQGISNECVNCTLVFGNYYCEICRLYDDTDKGQFHCDKCGICRVGGKDNFFHCNKCNLCLNKDLQNNHKCVENTANQKCPICCYYLFNSTESVSILKCGHSIHSECLKMLYTSNTMSSIRCPLCNKSSFDCTQLFQHLDNEIALTPMPEDLNYNIKILCNDCNKKSETKFHIIGHKCQDCGSYNTKRLT